MQKMYLHGWFAEISVTLLFFVYTSKDFTKLLHLCI